MDYQVTILKLKPIISKRPNDRLNSGNINVSQSHIDSKLHYKSSHTLLIAQVLKREVFFGAMAEDIFGLHRHDADGGDGA